MFSQKRVCLETGCHSARSSVPIYTYEFLQCGSVKDEVNSSHLGKNGTIAEGVAQCSQPRCDLTIGMSGCVQVWKCGSYNITLEADRVKIFRVLTLHRMDTACGSAVGMMKK